MSSTRPENSPPEPTTDQEWMIGMYTARDWAYGIFRDKTQHITDYSSDEGIVRGVDWTSSDGMTRYELECLDDYTDTGVDISSKYRLAVLYATERPWDYYQIVAGEPDAYKCDEDWEMEFGQNVAAANAEMIAHLRTNSAKAATLQTHSDMEDNFWKILNANAMSSRRSKFARWFRGLLGDI